MKEKEKEKVKLIENKTTDARVWATEMIKFCKQNNIVANEEFLTTWFSNIIEVTKEKSIKPNQNLKVWVFTDMVEEGYRFDSWNETEYCIIPKEYANGPDEAMEILDRIFEYIPKHESDSVSGGSRQLNKELVLVKEL